MKIYNDDNLFDDIELKREDRLMHPKFWQISSPEIATAYAITLKQRLPHYEHLIALDPEQIIMYTQFVLRKRWLSAEHCLLLSKQEIEDTFEETAEITKEMQVNFDEYSDMLADMHDDFDSSIHFKPISHRGNLYGPDANRENKLFAIKEAIQLGYDVEIDIIGDEKQLYLGHDNKQEKISLDFIIQYKDKLWVHCKNKDALNILSTQEEINYFYHETDAYTLTSQTYIWAFENSQFENKRLVANVRDLKLTYIPDTVHGVCTDYPFIYK